MNKHKLNELKTNDKRIDTNERITGAKIIQNSKFKSQKYKLKLKSRAKKLLTFDF